MKFSIFTVTNCYTGLFYYIIGNIEPKLRSSLRNIQLIACVKAPLIQEYGFEKVLEPFIEDANKLSNVSTKYHNIASIIYFMRLIFHFV